MYSVQHFKVWEAHVIGVLFCSFKQIIPMSRCLTNKSIQSIFNPLPIGHTISFIPSLCIISFKFLPIYDIIQFYLCSAKLLNFAKTFVFRLTRNKSLLNFCKIILSFEQIAQLAIRNIKRWFSIISFQFTHSLILNICIRIFIYIKERKLEKYDL